MHMFHLNIFYPQGNSHWVTGVLHMKEHRFEFFDSFGGQGSAYFGILLRYLRDEFEDKKIASLRKNKNLHSIDMAGWCCCYCWLVNRTIDSSLMNQTGECSMCLVHEDPVPQQKGPFDCGVYCYKFCECLAFNQPLDFTSDDIPTIRLQMMMNLLEHGGAGVDM